jgi:YaiO family outer membrane protein
VRTLIWSLLFAALAAAAPAPDAVASARALAVAGNRPAALELLEKRLTEEPADSDARTLRGIVLSWDGRYDEARRDLEAVLARRHDDGDAVRALMNVEMWSGHPDRATAVAREALRRDPNDPALLLALAKALRATGSSREALGALHHLIDVDPGNRDAADQEHALGDSLHRWTVSFDHATEWFSDHREPWREEAMQLNRQTAAGPVIARYSQASRFSLLSRQMEIDAYPHIRRGTYANVNAGYSTDAVLYPRYRLGAELYQSLGHGWEGSLGFRQMYFGGNVRIYTPSLTRYYGNWMFSGRLLLTPGAAGTSRSAGFEVRRNFADGASYWGVRYGRGSSPADTEGIYDLEILRASSFTFDFRRWLSRRLSVQCRFGVSREDRPLASGLRHYLAETSIFYRM